ncbi:MAG: aminotransferase class I/II-fold pyridoxal phosphate-dependent enzyme [Armatimonadota bacterium]|nr:aminotransferase class I/II-fold pyridoxal phosphate-dependent enzyme [Armatimonadota bacterium]MDR5689141.1 aminotransferase class I/II-fold pyridoxal phosphate-dependent enzyme [Armatimonadota bacterium]MDR7385953.1 aminotransferase class I/II-fold pyridoxal phosphate-dependent enzyme [Armatimonadota bacterium]MDR7389803.1 aminotransferase class I/II-fold pyridoxal phosphate-dependent enzyme [Armatimonadota bacterium]MDR7393668.1 aminotransferase class I/II-fold pyridoxal phosphate-depende
MSWTSRRARAIPQSVFLLMDRAKQEARTSGLGIIDLSLGSSDLSPPGPALQTLAEALLDRATHQYTLRSATRPFLEAASGWYEHRYGVTFDPDAEMLSLVGSQEGIGHLLLALTDPGDLVLIPEVAYPPYWGMAALAGLEVFPVPLREDLLPDLDAIPEEAARRARVLILNYPNNPTAAVADLGFFARALDFCRRHDVFLVHDNPYVDMVFDGPAPSPLALPGARDRCVEFFTLSKSYHMGGFRLAFAVGNSEAIAALETVKSALDFNQYQGILRMGITALQQPEAWVREQVAVFRERRDVLVRALQEAGWEVPLPRATMYLWARVPGEVDDVAFAVELCRRTGVALSPGQGFGPGGKGYVRIALVQPPERLEEAAARIGDFLRSSAR